MHRFAIATAALVFFFLNPGFGCSAEDPEFQYGEGEMRAAVEGTWVLTLGEAAGSPNEEITLRVTQSSKAQANATQSQLRTGLIRSAAACGSRTFVASANACIDYSEMPLDVALVSGPDSYKAASLSGDFRIRSLIFTQGTFDLSFGSVHVSAEITPDGTVKSVQGHRDGGGTVSVLSLLRTATAGN